MAAFVALAPPADAVTEVRPPGPAQLVLHGRELYVHYPDGQGASRWKVPFASASTGRNLNTVTKLAAMMRARR